MDASAVDLKEAAWVALKLGAVALLARPAIANDPESLMRSQTRQRIADIVRQEPGIPVGALRRRAGIGWGAFYNHYGRMVAAGILATRTSGKRTLVFPSEQAEDPLDTERRALLQGDTVRRIAVAIAERPHANVNDLARHVGATPRLIYYHLRRLLALDLVEARRGWRDGPVVAAPTLAAALETVRAPVSSLPGDAQDAERDADERDGVSQVP